MKYACLFPGQGSQQVGMGKDICGHWQVARETFLEANDVLGFDLTKLCFTGPQTQLTATQYAQPAILTTSVALLRVLAHQEIKPAAVAGHSIGSFAALVAAEALTFADALRAVQQRGLLMAAVQQRGSMLAVACANQEKLNETEALAREQYALDVAAYNSPSQIVFSGLEEAIQALQDALADKSGLQARRFAVSHAFHSRLMAEKKKCWEQYLEGLLIARAHIPVGLNVTGEFTQDAQQIRADLIEQFTSAVQWHHLFSQLVEQSYDLLFEVGMGRTLTGLARAWHEKPTVLTTDSTAALTKVLKYVQAQPTIAPAA